MRTITVDILNEYALNLLKDLEALKIIRVRKEKDETQSASLNLVARYKGAMTKQPLKEVDEQLNDIRNEWS